MAAAAGLAAWIVHLQQGLILSHYDAKAHLVVARRVIDNITPGWQQIGAVWLPLPHLINLLPTQADLFYRTGAFASVFSIACFAVAVWAAARLILAITGSSAGAVTATALLVLNPNVLYLQTTPMTEPLLQAVTMLAVLWAYEWVIAAGSQDAVRAGSYAVPAKLRWVLFAAAWTRYEAWAILGILVPAIAYALWRQGMPVGVLARTVVGVVAWPAVAVVLFLINSRVTVGSWFVAGGFYVPDVEYQDRPVRSLVAVWWGTHQLSGYVVETVALASAGVMAVRALLAPSGVEESRRAEAALLIPISLFAAAALPFYAFHSGHPFRIRYMVPLVCACALFSGLCVGFGAFVGRAVAPRHRRTFAPSHLRIVIAALLIAAAVYESPPWDEHAPMLAEAQWDVPASLNRRDVTACLERDGHKVLASMGSLAHYMQELSHAGFGIADFVNEGNGSIWELAMETGPAPHAGWMLVEEQAEGGDVLAQRIRADAAFARGMTRVCEGGGVALYKRQ